jgi:hypothetical protein
MFGKLHDTLNTQNQNNGLKTLTARISPNLAPNNRPLNKDVDKTKILKESHQIQNKDVSKL